MKKVFELALSGRNTTQIAYGMNELQFPTPGLYAKRKNLLMGSNPIIAPDSEMLWNAAIVWRILRRYEYTGALVMGRRKKIDVNTTSIRTLPEDKWIIAENAHEAIVTKDEYYQAQKAIRNVTPIQYKVGDDFALKGKICCGNCKRQLRHEKQYGEMVFCCGYKRAAGKFSKCYGGYYREYSEVCTLLSINIDDYKKQLEDLNGKSVEDQFYGLKTQYIYPLIEKENIIYIPSPYLVINAVTESMLNRVTFGDEQLRREFGKEVIESYLYDIASQVKTVSWISKEIVYNVGHQEIRSPDVLVGEGEKMTFYDTKAFSPSLRLRSLDRTEIENDIARYAKNVIQLYKQIVNYLAGKFELDKHYEKKDIFGVVVVLEDAVVSRKKVYDKVFLELERTAHLDDEEKRYIHSHIKVLPLREVETFMLQNMSPLPFLVEQVENENQWDNYRYGCPQKENGLIAEYESYVKKLKSMLIARIRTV